MKTIFPRLLAAGLLGLGNMAQAALHDRGNGLVYDDALDITWLQDANYAKTSGYDADGLMSWDDAVIWADQLEYGGYDDWRLASMSVAAGVPIGATTVVADCKKVSELECRDNELAYMFYYNLGGNPGQVRSGDQTSVDGVPLRDIGLVHLSGTEVDFVGVNSVFAFQFFGGSQFGNVKTIASSAWAVRDGDVLPPPTTCEVFPPDNPWNTDISSFSIHPNSNAYLASIGWDEGLHPDFGTTYQGRPNGIPYVFVDDSQPDVPVVFYAYRDESDLGPYPIPPDAPIEGGNFGRGDRHVLVLDEDDCVLYELYAAYRFREGALWLAASGARFDLTSNELRPDGWTSADAAGLPIYPGLVRYDEVVEEGVIDHALRVTVERTQAGYIHPATHYASSSTDPNLPPMGLRIRMKAGYDCSGFSPEVQVICAALKKYGMFVADNGGDLFISGAPDPRWNDDNLADLKQIEATALEVVYTGEIISD